MGNAQTNEGKSGKVAKGKVKGIMRIRGKKNQGEAQFTEIVSKETDEKFVGNLELQEDNMMKLKALEVDDKQCNLKVEQPKATDSWYSANEEHEETISKIATPSSIISSESNYMDAPQVSQDYNVTSISDSHFQTHDTPDNFLHNLTLNSFKLNEYRMKHEVEKCKKLNKLGVSKTSQISLDSDPRERFETGEVHVIRNMESNVCVREQIWEVREENNVVNVNKRMSESNLNSTGLPDYKRHMSVPDDASDLCRSPDSGVLKKVTSLTLSRTDLESKISKPKFVPEKLDFQLYEKFEGHMLINWYISEVNENHSLGNAVSEQELKLLAAQFCTHLLAAGVLKQLRDKDVPRCNVFKPDCIYYWTYAEIPQSVPQTPGRISMVSWPPTSPASCDVTTKSVADDIVVLSAPEQPDDSNSENEVSPSSTRRGEFNSSARDVEILSLEEEIRRLRQEVEKYKTLVEIQTLTENAVKDFDSPIDEIKTIGQIRVKSVIDKSSRENTVLSEKQLKNQNEEIAQTNEIRTSDAGSQTEDILFPGNSNSKNYQSIATSPTQNYFHTIQETKSTSTSELLVTQINDEFTFSRSHANSYRPSQDTPHSTPEQVLNHRKFATPSDPSFPGLPIETSATAGIPPPPPLSGNTCIPPPPPFPGNTCIPPPPPLPGNTYIPTPPPLLGIPPPPPLPGNTCIPPPPPLPANTCIPPPPHFPGNICVPPPPPLPANFCVPYAPAPPPPPLPENRYSSPPPPPPPIPGNTHTPPAASTVLTNFCPIPPPPPPMTAGNGSTIPPSPSTKSDNQRGPPSLPPPPAGGWDSQKAALRKSQLKPKSPMKPLYWTRIIAPQTIAQDDSKFALWNEIDELSTDTLDEFSLLFSRQVVTRKPSAVKKVERKEKKDAVKLLDSKRSQNVGILAQSLHIDFQEIENAVYNFDTSTVSLEALQQIYEARGTQDEMELIKNHLATKPDVPLDKPEHFLYELSEISNFAERISCLMFMVEFEDSVNTISHTLANIKSTCKFLISSQELKKLFAIILTLGNYMNGGNLTRGQADGFGLEILGKLKDVKSNDSKITLLHYIVRMYLKSVDNSFDLNIALPIPQPEDIRRAASVNFDDMKINLQKLQKQLEGCEIKYRIVVENSTTENLQPFENKMTTFLDHSKKQLIQENENLDECRTEIIQTMRFYLFQPKTGTLETFPPNSFFELWLSFCIDFKDIFQKELMKMGTEKMKEIKKKETEMKSLVVKTKERQNGLKAKVKRYQEKLS